MADSPAHAIELLASRVAVVGMERAPLASCAGRVLAEAVHADRASPAMDVSAMDGFAVRGAEIGDNWLPIASEVRIGALPPPLSPGAVARIVTGGAIPPGADAVVKVEDTESADGRMRVLPAVRPQIRPGASIRFKGENVAAGGLVMEPGREITAAGVTALASFGLVSPLVYRKVRVAIISTGDEVVAPEATPADWQLRDSNGPALHALLSCRQWIEVVSIQRLRDDPDLLRESIDHALATSDALFLSGGVSMGHRDFVPSCLAACGAAAVFHKIPQRPGRPMLGAIGPKGQAIMALPGNPLSVLVTARRIAIPVLERISGQTEFVPPAQVPVADSGQPLNMWRHRLVRFSAGSRSNMQAEFADGKGSGDVVAAAASEGFVEIPPGCAGSGPWRFYPWA